jgi:hypothetical protein
LLKVCAFHILVEGGCEDSELVCEDLNLFGLVDLENGTEVSQVVRIDCFEELIVLLASQCIVGGQHCASIIDLLD